MARTLAQIDQALAVERSIWAMERRSGDNTAEARTSRERLDALLEERNAAEKAAAPAPGEHRVMRLRKVAMTLYAMKAGRLVHVGSTCVEAIEWTHADGSRTHLMPLTLR